MREIGTALKKLRCETGLTQKELAAKVSGGLDYTYIGKIERGEQLPSLKILMKISEALAVPVGYFFRDSAGTEFLPHRITECTAGKLEGELMRELKHLHKNDIPLVVEIVRALNKHRRAERKKDYVQGAGPLPLAAEDGPSYKKP